MAESILVDLAPSVRRHPWWNARSQLVIALLNRLNVDSSSRICDVGCGWGVTLEALESRGYHVTGMDVSPRALQRLDRPGRDLILADLARPVPPDADPFDAALALDVIEHIDNDREAVHRLGEMVGPGGWVIVSVPARPDLWTEFDEVQGHRRRYLPETLSAAFAGSKLTLHRVFWWGQWLVKAIRFQRARPKRASETDTTTDIYKRYLSLPAWPGPLALRMAFALERDRAIDGKLRTGTSLFAVARRAD